MPDSIHGGKQQSINPCWIALWLLLGFWALAFILNFEDKGWRALYDWSQPEPTPLPVREIDRDSCYGLSTAECRLLRD